ncbi:MAG: outer membrane beta-barrel domain-containing protein [Bdellovibrionales bacterium]|nr:outer membrane beta-barrel domain-containing protein [Bdellovibrionales bacterium]
MYTSKNHWNLIRFLAIAFIALSPLQKGQAKDEEPKKIENADSDKLDIQKLEKKYWAAKDDDFTVIQNRAFQKEKRFFGSLNYGVPFNDPNSVGSLTGLNFGYFLNERWGFEYSYVTANLKENDTTDYFRSQYGALPNHNTFKGAQTLMAYYIPIYAKMSLLDKKIIYFDMGVGLGFGQTSYEQNSCVASDGCIAKSSVDSITKTSQSASHYALTIMQQFFLSQHWAIRIDLINRFTNESRVDSRDRTDIGSKSINDTAFQFGITYWK